MVDTGQHRECLLRSLACNCRTPYLSVLLAASCRKSIGKHQQPNATAGAEAAPSSVFNKNKKRQKRKRCYKPARLGVVRHQVVYGCYRTPTTRRCITSGRFAGRRSTAVWRGPQAPPQGQAGLPTPESWDDGDLTRKCNGNSQKTWENTHTHQAQRGSHGQNPVGKL